MELLIYMSIVTVGLVVLTGFIADVTKTAARAKTTQESQQNARLVMSRLTQDIRNAESIDLANSQMDNDHGSLRIIKNSLPTTYSWSNGGVSFSNASGTSIITTDKINITQLRFEQTGNTTTIKITAQTLQLPSTPQNQIVLSSSVVPRPLIY